MLFGNVSELLMWGLQAAGGAALVVVWLCCSGRGSARAQLKQLGEHFKTADRSFQKWSQGRKRQCQFALGKRAKSRGFGTLSRAATLLMQADTDSGVSQQVPCVSPTSKVAELHGRGDDLNQTTAIIPGIQISL